MPQLSGLCFRSIWLSTSRAMQEDDSSGEGAGWIQKSMTRYDAYDLNRQLHDQFNQPLGYTFSYLLVRIWAIAPEAGAPNSLESCKHDVKTWCKHVLSVFFACIFSWPWELLNVLLIQAGGRLASKKLGYHFSSTCVCFCYFCTKLSRNPLHFVVALPSARLIRLLRSSGSHIHWTQRPRQRCSLSLRWKCHRMATEWNASPFSASTSTPLPFTFLPHGAISCMMTLSQSFYRLRKKEEVQEEEADSKKNSFTIHTCTTTKIIMVSKRSHFSNYAISWREPAWYKRHKVGQAHASSATARRTGTIQPHHQFVFPTIASFPCWCCSI